MLLNYKQVVIVGYRCQAQFIRFQLAHMPILICKMTKIRCYKTVTGVEHVDVICTDRSRYRQRLRLTLLLASYQVD